MVLPSRRRVLVSDTVGFIGNLPTTLVKAFRATLEEVKEAALILHVVDASSAAAADHMTHVSKVLAEIGAEAIPQILVLNKIDRLTDESVARRFPAPAVAVSALTGAGIDGLLAAIDQALPLDPIVHATLRLPTADGATLALLHEFGRVLGTRYTADGAEVEVEAEIPESLKRRLSLAS
jgi:GTP-binding protein HflX